MSVGAGSLLDPRKPDGSVVNGLAHFCEHMLFLGTRKYPEENTYKSFLSVNGGASNASTSLDMTNYHFDIKNEKFSECISIFSEFFKEPLFTESCVDREMNAVHNEYKKNLSDEGRGLY